MTGDGKGASVGAIKALTYMMFMMFALTTESVGLIIPEVMRIYHLGMTASGAFHYAPMAAIAVAGLGLGFLADRLGRKRTILLGLSLFSANAFLFAFADDFAQFLLLLSLSGAAIGIFKTGALALIGDISRSATDHTATMNMAEGFFGLGSIVGPAIVGRLLLAGIAWKWLYVLAGAVCVVLVAVAGRMNYPRLRRSGGESIGLARTVRLAGRPLVLAFSLACFLYVGIECSIYVWLPTWLAGDPDLAPPLVIWAIPAFFLLRAGGRFLGARLLLRVEWTALLLLFALLILACFVAAVIGGRAIALFSLPLSGLFMSVLYPTLNSKGISCHAKSEHGAVAGVLLFFTCVGAALGPLAMGAASDLFGDARYCFVLAALFAALLSAGLGYNWLKDPTRLRLSQLDRAEYDARMLPSSGM